MIRRVKDCVTEYGWHLLALGVLLLIAATAVGTCGYAWWSSFA